MTPLWGLSFSVIEILITVVGGFLTFAVAFVLASWYWSLDRRTEAYDDKLRQEIREDTAFSGIRRAAHQNYIATSDSRISKFITALKDTAGRQTGALDKIVVVKSPDLRERKIEMIRERARDIPGKNILSKELVGALRNHYAYQLALSQEEISSDIVEHFKRSLDEYEHSSQVETLSEPESFEDVVLIEPTEHSRRDVLNDIFLPLVRASEIYCVDLVSDTQRKRAEVDRCQEILMLTFFGLWAGRMKGIIVLPDMDEDECETAYRHNIRDVNNWGYWMLSEDQCEEGEFRRLRHLAWQLNDIINDYWSEHPYKKLHPKGDSIREMEQVDRPFVIFQKDEDIFRGGGPGGPS
jgi:hypothetical protein